MSAETGTEVAPAPADEAGHPYPEDAWPEIAEKYADLAERCARDLELWDAAARDRVFARRPARLTAIVAAPLEPLPDPELPLAVPAAESRPRLRFRDLMRRQRHAERPADEVPDDLGEHLAEMDAQVAAMPARGRHARPAGQEQAPAAVAPDCHWPDCRDSGACDQRGQRCGENVPRPGQPEAAAKATSGLMSADRQAGPGRTEHDEAAGAANFGAPDEPFWPGRPRIEPPPGAEATAVIKRPEQEQS